jgi:hypothetical protein
MSSEKYIQTRKAPVERLEYILEEKNVVDISKKNVKEIYEMSIVKNWIKLITLGDNVILFSTYNRKEHFKLVANICIDDETCANGNKKRNTTIQFSPTISTEDWKEEIEWIYLLLINDRIVKIGSTRTGLCKRAASYLCGHHIRERGKSGDCSKTNGFIYNTIDFYLNAGCKIEMYAYELPVIKHVINILDKNETSSVQTCHLYEGVFLEDYKKTYTDYPILSRNCHKK